MPRQDTNVLHRRAEVAARYLKGELQSDLATSFGVSQAQISHDLKVIRATWLASAVRAQELAKIDQVEREYWLAWERSQQDKEVAYSERGPKGTKAGERREGQAGNAAFLDGVLKCIAKRCEILGLDAPKRFNVTLDWETLSDEQIDQLIAGKDPHEVLAA
jgi:hypothetical protein